MRRLIAVLAAALVLGGPAAAAALPNDGPTGRISGITTSTGSVQFVLSADNLSAQDRLDPNSVQVSAGGRSFEATASANGDPGAATQTLPVREVVLTLDTSGSMQGDGIAAARAAALAYAKNLPADVRVGLVTFSDAPQLLVPPTTDRAKVAGAINRVAAGGNTALYDGVVTAVNAMKQAPPNAERRLVILSDGDDTASTRSISAAISALTGGKVSADVVAFRLPGDRTALNQLAAASKGRVLPATSAGDLAGAFAAAAQAFRQQILVTAKVPDALSGQTVTLTVSVNAGSQSLMASTPLTLPKTAGAKAPATEIIASPAKSTSPVALAIVLAVAFAALLVVALVVLWVPATSAERTAKSNRLAEVGRYRLVESVGRNNSAAAATSTESGIARATLGVVDKAVRARGKRQGLVDELDRSGLRIRPEEWAFIQLAAVVTTGAVLAFLFSSPVGLFVGGALGFLGCKAFINGKTRRRQAAFAEQLPDMLQLIAGSLRSGFSLNQAVAGVVREGTEPSASEIARALTEVRLGSELEDALDDVADRMKCLDLHLVVLAIRTSREVGGNLAEVLLTTVGTMRERAQLRGQVQVLSAEGRLSAKILIGLPFLMAGYLFLFRPDYIRPLFTTAGGVAMLAAGAILLSLGAFWLSRLVKIEV